MDDDQDRGLYGKYIVIRKDDYSRKHDGCFYFVLDLDHDKFAAPALRAYAAACREEYPALAEDLEARVGSLEAGCRKAAPDAGGKR